MNNTFRLFAGLLFALVFTLQASSVMAQSAIDGVWEAVSSTNAEGETATYYNPGQLIFHGGYYSMLTIRGTEARPKYEEGENRGTVSNEKLLAIMGPVTAQSGKFEVDGSSLTLRPTVMINPNRTDETKRVLSYELSGQNLSLRFENGAGYNLRRLAK